MSEDSTSISVEPPKGCAGCGLRRAVDADNPAPHETRFDRVNEDADAVQFECATCGTVTHVPKDPPPMVECRSCGDDIPESLQGHHSCESHPLGSAADMTFENPFEDHR